ncbi:hypothetical protein [Rathayibacter tanaceti]|uniref:Uncharacterized protein n=2 Tax=Rathayibacter tanaceti TaxID=1671680 RepID=A0A166ICT4_9MICO|nr:hypothetical protein [Rathayibacter tanaceti]KZX22166.1 hypothetical protein ACH61_00733 [Rathayibacter tanaceti]QHC54454.1 hypothetical protein GSU10_01440 [Rathayibacter tanaceti]TCO35060.1 hypothetical protein EV639_10964 [Rathayibacter tanaceti]
MDRSCWSDARPTGRQHQEIADAGLFELPQSESLLFSLDVRALADFLLRLATTGRIEALRLPEDVDLTSAGDRANVRR